MEPVFIPLVLTAVTLSFLVSASAGFGGSLILVPTLALVMGTKSGVALAALLLAANNVVKLIAYRKTLPWRRSALIVLLVGIGAGVGAVLLVAAPERVVTIAVILGFGLAFLTEQWDCAGSGWSRPCGPLTGAGSAPSGRSAVDRLAGIAVSDEGRVADRPRGSARRRHPHRLIKLICPGLRGDAPGYADDAQCEPGPPHSSSRVTGAWQSRSGRS